MRHALDSVIADVSVLRRYSEATSIYPKGPTQVSNARSSSAERTFQVISAVATRAGAGLSLSELAKECGMALSSCHRYVSTLQDLAVLERDSNGQIKLGVGLVALAEAYLGADTLRNAARPHLVRLAAACGETAHLGRLSGAGVVYVDKVECDKSIRLVSRIGSTVPLHCSAMGKSILATLPAQDWQRYASAATEHRTEYTLIGQDLIDEIGRVATQGWAIDEQENELGVRCLGAAIVSATGVAVGALSISGPADRFSRTDCRRIAPDVISAARAIGARLY
ncbi:MAG: IclR family transcriptional regulator [Bifidobacteriaceae bacterium]|jgi:DNA-binding IclR family transcriptional regulator|nr:IclR family transcriptional regulator [Bifidobacteriaceae bacterium]